MEQATALEQVRGLLASQDPDPLLLHAALGLAQGEVFDDITGGPGPGDHQAPASGSADVPGPVRAGILVELTERDARRTARAQLVAADLAARAPVLDLDEEQLQGINAVRDDLPGFIAGRISAPAESRTAVRGRRRFRTAADYLTARLHLSHPEAKRRLDGAALLLPRATMTGEPLPPALPILAGQVRAGAADVRDAITVGRRLELLSGALEGDPEAGAKLSRVEEIVGSSLETHPLGTTLKVLGELESAARDPEAAPGREERRRRQGLFYLGRRRGLHEFRLCADTPQAELILNACDVTDNPHLADRASRTPFTASSPRGGPESAAPGPEPADPEPGQAAGLGIPAPDWMVAPGTAPEDRPRSTLDDGSGAWPGDPATDLGGAVRLPGDPAGRTSFQRRLDGFLDLVLAGLTGADPARGPGITPTIASRTKLIVFTDLDTLSGRLEKAGRTAHGARLTAGEVRRLACEAEIIPAVLGGPSELLDLGRSRRLFSDAQRLAVMAVEPGCIRPGCRMPAARCEMNHLHAWEDGGPTDLANAVPTCTLDHAGFHAGEFGVVRIDGILYYVPPKSEDPLQRPVRNVFWHPECAEHPHAPGWENGPPAPDPGPPG